MPRKTLPTLSMSALLTFVGFAAMSTACAEGAALPMQPAIRKYAVANSQMKQTVSAISNTHSHAGHVEALMVETPPGVAHSATVI